jgi:dTMP kinase
VKERGRLIALEGADGSGKTTQARLLAQFIGALSTAEPGGTAVGERLRALLLDPERGDLTVRAEALLMAADRAQHVAEVIAPALDAGRWVVTDRYSGSTLAYQGYGRGLELGELESLVRWATGGVRADLTVVVDVDEEVARARRSGGTEDRLERLDESFFLRVRNGYLSLAAADPEGWVVVDGTGDVAEVAERVAAVVAERLGPLPPHVR